MLYLLVIAAVILIIYIFVKSREKAKRAKYLREENERENKQKELSAARKEKFKNNENVKAWASETAERISSYISGIPHRNHEFHFKPYKEDITYGFNLQDIWLPNIREIVRAEGCQVMGSYNFMQYNLPKLIDTEDMNNFSEVFCELVSSELSQKNISTYISDIRRCVDKQGYMVEGLMEDDRISVLKYTPPSATGNW